MAAAASVKSPEQVLKDKGIVLPEATAPAFSYVHVVRTGNQLWTAGQIPRLPNKEFLHNGKVGRNVSIEQAQEAARLCILHALTHIRKEIGSLDNVRRVIKVVGFIASAEGFTQQPQVMNAASDFLIEIFGDAGRHARSAVGVAELPLGVCVEVEMVVEAKQEKDEEVKVCKRLKADA